MSSADRTPVDKETPFELVLAELLVLKGLCQTSATNTLAVLEDVKGVKARVSNLEDARVADRFAWYWAPMLFSSVALLGMLWLAFKFGHG